MSNNVNPPGGFGAANVNNVNLQAYIELVVMNTANNLLYNKMAPLESALELTQAALSDLATIQDIHNLVKIVSPGPPPPANSSWLTGAASVYYSKAIQITPNFSLHHFSQASINKLGNFPSSNSLGIDGTTYANAWGYNNNTLFYLPVSGFATNAQFTFSFATSMATTLPSQKILGSAQAARIAADFFYPFLSAGAKNPFTSALQHLLSTKALISALIPKLSTAAATGNPNSLYSQMKEVLADLNANNLSTNEAPVFIVTNRKILVSVNVTQEGGLPIGSYMESVYVYSGYYSYAATNFGKWLIDGYNTQPSTGGAGAGVASAGSINQNITSAITAAESLNTTQSTQVSSYLQTYQSYFQAAASMLTQMNQIIMQMAQNMTGR